MLPMGLYKAPKAQQGVPHQPRVALANSGYNNCSNIMRLPTRKVLLLAEFHNIYSVQTGTRL